MINAIVFRYYSYERMYVVSSSTCSRNFIHLRVALMYALYLLRHHFFSVIFPFLRKFVAVFYPPALSLRIIKCVHAIEHAGGVLPPCVGLNQCYVALHYREGTLLALVCCKDVLKAKLAHGAIVVAREVPGGHASPKFLEHIVILCFERRYPKQNSVIRPKSNILDPKNF